MTVLCFYVLCVFCLNLCLCAMYLPGASGGQKTWRSEKDMGSSETGVTEDPEMLCGCWESNPCPQKGQQVLLTAEPTLP